VLFTRKIIKMITILLIDESVSYVATKKCYLLITLTIKTIIPTISAGGTAIASIIRMPKIPRLIYIPPLLSDILI